MASEHKYLAPKIVWLPQGYKCSVINPPERIGHRIRNGTGRISLYARVYWNGTVRSELKHTMTFDKGVLLEATHRPFVWSNMEDEWGLDGGFVEIGADAADDNTSFTSPHLPSLYVAYGSPLHKAFFTCVQYKFGEPRVIDQIANFGRFLDGYPVVHINKQHDYGESLVFVNPYKMPLVADVKTNDGRVLPRCRIAALSSKRLDLAALLKEGESEWSGQVQITASNRVITYTLKHSYAEKHVITTVEHMDPFRAEPTHMASTQWLRARVGEWLARSKH